VDFEEYIQYTANSPACAHHIIQSIIPDIPVAPDAKKKQEENKKRGVGR